ncbi:hypothetical protein [Flagellimonas marina]|uniref:Uncharacterized protein n=1 Tax=Flagellimonas marina TaxID=1775168 RepID=A0ABV8PP07_9FLAO
MNRLIAHIFLALYFLAMARPVAPLLEYIIYEDYISEFLCINKDNTELQCNGKCYLMQRISEQNEQKKQNLPRIVLEEYPIGFVEIFDLDSEDIFCDQLPNGFHYINTYAYLYCALNFHPPSSVG